MLNNLHDIYRIYYIMSIYLGGLGWLPLLRFLGLYL